MMGRIHVGCRELEKAFRKHITLCESGGTSSHFLLLFYAIECGLKYLYLRENRLTSTGDIQDQGLTNDKDCSGHDLGKWAKAAKISAPEGGFGSIRINNDKWSVCKTHQAWRYGAIINQDDEGKVVESLKNMKTLLNERI
jgi:hypothetical protein